MINTKEGLRSLSLEIENFKNIEKYVIDIGGKSLLIIGKNGSGKSSFIQAMTSAMDAKTVPSEPIKKGEERATVKHRIGGMVNGQYEEYTLDIFFTPKNKTGRLVVYNSKGEAIKSPATFVKGLIGNVSFDVTKWLNDSKAKKLETIKALTGCGKDIDLINIDIVKLKADMKYKKDRYEQLEGALQNHEFSEDEKELYSKPEPLEPIQAQFNAVLESQQKYDAFANKVEGARKDVQGLRVSNERITSEVAELEQKILSLKNTLNTNIAQITSMTINIDMGDHWLKTNPRPNLDAVNAKMAMAVQHNEKHNRITMLGSQHMEILQLKRDAGNAKGEIDTKEAARAEIIAKSQLPIPGLTFSEDELFIDNLPLQEGQQNTQKLFDVGVEVAIALNPNLKVIFLHAASLFDKEQLKIIIDKIESRGYQAIAEIVDDEAGDLHVKFTEEALDPLFETKEAIKKLKGEK